MYIYIATSASIKSVCIKDIHHPQFVLSSEFVLAFCQSTFEFSRSSASWHPAIENIEKELKFKRDNNYHH